MGAGIYLQWLRLVLYQTAWVWVPALISNSTFLPKQTVGIRIIIGDLPFTWEARLSFLPLVQAGLSLGLCENLGSEPENTSSIPISFCFHSFSFSVLFNLKIPSRTPPLPRRKKHPKSICQFFMSGSILGNRQESMSVLGTYNEDEEMENKQLDNKSVGFELW